MRYQPRYHQGQLVSVYDLIRVKEDMLLYRSLHQRYDVIASCHVKYGSLFCKFIDHRFSLKIVQLRCIRTVLSYK